MISADLLYDFLREKDLCGHVIGRFKRHDNISDIISFTVSVLR